MRAAPPKLPAPTQAQLAQRVWRGTHHGARRVVWRHDSVEWLRTGESAAGPIVLPASRVDVVTGLPDLSELRPRPSPRAYEEWLAEMAELLVRRLAPDRVAIFYLTPGRYSGEGGSWLDKGFHVQRGARAAGAACVWQKVVLVQDAAGRRRGGVRAGFVNLLCFSRAHRVPADFVTVDVLPDRGHMRWSHAIGEAACRAAVEYITAHVNGGGGHAAESSHAPEEGEEAAGGAVAGGGAAEDGAAVPSTRSSVLNPFCGHGGVLAVANAYGLDAYGMDVSLKCCRHAAEERG